MQQATKPIQPQLTLDFNAGRLFDIVAATAAILLLLPVLMLVALAVKLTSRGPAVFRHNRIGLGGEQFGCLKFRTMVVDADQRLAALLESDPAAREEWMAAHKLRNDPRVTPIGVILRKLSLDELPQFINVIRGDMSLVGPRPIVAAEVPKYGRHFGVYCSVRPGITGLWQISGRSDTSYRRRVALDVAYARAKSLRLDVAILVMTVPRVLFGRGSY